MSRTSSSITIRRPIEDVFAVLTDVENTGTWFPGNVEEHWTSAPPHGVGSTRHAVVTVMGRRTENDAVVTAYEPPHRAVMEGTSANAPFVATLTFALRGRRHARRRHDRPHLPRRATDRRSRSSRRCTAAPGTRGWRPSSG